MSTELSKVEPASAGNPTQREQFAVPHYWTSRNNDNYEIQVCMPGVDKSGVEVSQVDDQLTVVGRRKNQLPDDWRPIYRQVPTLDFRLRVRLNVKVDQDRAEAHIEDGILTLRLPIHEEAKPRVIDVH